MKAGSLIIVGTGINIGQLTIEAQGWLEIADKVLYCVSDPATERMIMRLNSTAESLYGFYGEGKRRSDTYQQMIERTLECLRMNEKVVVAYYGHPGFFVYPSHRAITLARSEGYDAFMCPAVSSFDCLIADLGINVASGCQIFEATDLMLRQREIDTSAHIVILQVASVGDIAYSFNGFDLRNLPSVGEYLLKRYPADFEAKIYYASQFSVGQPRIDAITIADLLTDKLKSIATLYLPPLRTAPINLQMVRQYQLEEALLKDKRLVPLNESMDQIC